jgi:hypothetical protein
MVAGLKHGVQIGRQLGAAMRSHSDCVIAGGIGERTGVGHVGAGRVVACSLPLKASLDQAPDRRGPGFDSLALGPGLDGLFDLLRQPDGKNVRGLLPDPRAA